METLALLRLDGDMYSSTWEVLIALYEKVAVGGYVVIDDYDLRGCKSAIDDFRRTYGISEKLHFPRRASMHNPHTGAYWKKERNVTESGDARSCILASTRHGSDL